MLCKLKIVIIFAILTVFVTGQKPNPADAKSLDSLIADIFKPVDEFGLQRGSTTVRPPPTVAPPSFDCPNGRCVAQYLCDETPINSDGRSRLDLKFAELTGPRQGQQNCYDYWETCCRFENIKTEPIVEPPPKPLECGYRNRNGIAFQSTNNRNQSEYGEFPWMVAITRVDLGVATEIFVAGGSIIHPNVVLTAAHYVQGWTGSEQKLSVRAGEWDTQTTNELFPHQDRRVSRIIVHDQFNNKNLHNDIALLVLESPLELNDVVQPICMPPQNHVFDFSQCVASGWGKNEFGKNGKYAVIMKKVDLTVIPRQSCQNAFRTTRLGRHFILDESFICAGSDSDADTCRGDGGSPLVCPIPFGAPDRYYQAGVVAWGIGCGDRIPAAYTNVALFRPWINQQMAQLRLETSYFEL